MFQIGIIGSGAIAGYVAEQLNNNSDTQVSFALVTERSLELAAAVLGDSVSLHTSFADARARPDLVVDCAGHAGLAQHGPEILAAGIDLVSISVGAMADDALAQQLATAAEQGARDCQRFCR